MPISDKREYRTMPVMNIVQRAEGEEKSYRVRGYATTWNDPYVLYHDYDGNPIYEQIDRHALDEADVSDVVMLYNHQGRVFARNRNGTLQLSVDDHGYLVEADLGRTENARNMFEDIDAGMVDQMSWAFTIKEESYNKETRTITVMKVAKVFDVSGVSIPANPGTEISAARKRMLDGVIEQERAERLEAEARKNLELLEMRLKLLGAPAIPKRGDRNT